MEAHNLLTDLPEVFIDITCSRSIKTISNSSFMKNIFYKSRELPYYDILFWQGEGMS